MKLTVGELAKRIAAELIGDGPVEIEGVGPVESADKSKITFVTNDKYIDALKKSVAGAVLVTRAIEGLSKPQLVVEDIDTALIEVLSLFAPDLKAVPEGIDPGAKIGEDAKIAESASIGYGAVIDDGVEIGKNTIISAGCKIGQNSQIGDNCRLDSNVVVYHNCVIGNHVIIQANSTIGSTGFGYSLIEREHRLIPHNGIVVIEDFVEIGANCCIDRAKFGETKIGAGTKIDNLVQIAHNVIIGKCCLIVAQVGIAGSSKLGDGVILAGQVGIADNIDIGEKVIVGAKAGVIHNIASGKHVYGSPANDIKETLKTICLTRRLPKLVEQLKQLSKRLEKLEAAKNNKE